MADWKSPYGATKVIGRFMGYYVHRKIPAHRNDVVRSIVSQWVSRPDLMALDIYGDPDLWIAIPTRNALEDPCYDLTLGRELVVPPLDHVLACLGA
jgi:hypothetical protein